ncbi:MAG: NADPH-dependent glutamate synthase [Candidatus Bathyarchaeota archaeon]|nr:NADPH-dependent glutamate synthase [Candidatus Bathyarchaeota archaeon]
MTDSKHKDLSKRPSMNKQPPVKRVRNFNEVALGLTQEQAVKEAERCLQCKDPKCIKGCPVEINIPLFIKFIKERKFNQAIEVIKERDNIPAITGRVCPQETQCEIVCILKKLGEPIAIGALERYVSDYELKTKIQKISKLKKKEIGKKIAVIGSGPAGLTAAGDLSKLGYKVTIFEALHEPGGVLTYGIPEFRMPKGIVRSEVEYIKRLGVEIKTNMIIGKILTIKDLFNLGYDAIFIGSGAGSPHFLGINGENLIGVYSANEFLTRVNLMKAYLFPKYHTPIKIGKNTIVIGGGNVAMDAARTSLRLGSDVFVIYRRTEKEMPARTEEIYNAKEEGVKLRILTSPVKIFGDEKGRVKSLECIKMKLGQPDETGRKRPIEIPGSNFSMDCDTVIIAIGQAPNPLISNSTKGLKTDDKGYLIVDKNGRTSIKGVWAAGDIVPDSGTVIEAMGRARKAVIDINKCLSQTRPTIKN